MIIVCLPRRQGRRVEPFNDTVCVADQIDRQSPATKPTAVQRSSVAIVTQVENHTVTTG